MNAVLHKLSDLRGQIKTCDVKTAGALPRTMYGLVTETLDPRLPCVYVVECLPGLCVAMNNLLRALGSFGRHPRNAEMIEDARRDMLRMLDIFCDEVNLLSCDVDVAASG